MTRVFFEKKIKVYRLSSIQGSKKEEYILNGTIYGALFPVDAESSMLSDGNPAKTSILYVPNDADIKETDKINFDSVDYIVGGVRTFNFGGVKIKECIVEELES